MRAVKGKKRFLSWKWMLPAGVAILALGCWAKNITTPYYTQTTSYYCGAASAQMILNSEKLGIYVPSQATLYNYIHPRNQCSNWYTDPKGLKDVLNNYAGTKAHFVVSALANQNDGVKKLAYTIDKYGVPPASLIYGCMHWVVVRGVITDVQPTTSSSYTINGFFVNDPWYGSTSLGENKYIDIAHWKSDYFTGCGWCGSPGGDKYISVVDPDPLPKVMVKFPSVMPRKAAVISPRMAQERAMVLMKQFNKQKGFQQQFGEALGIINTSRVGDPVLVKRSDETRNAYYIVPLLKGALTSGAILLDAYSGQFQEATYVKQPLEYTNKLQASTATRIFRQKLPELKIRPELNKMLKIEPVRKISPTMVAKKADSQMKTFRELNIKPSEVTISKVELVWQPSEESQNPYYPLWKVTGSVRSAKNQTIGFMDFKGKVVPDIKGVTRVEMKGGGAR